MCKKIVCLLFVFVLIGAGCSDPEPVFSDTGTNTGSDAGDTTSDVAPDTDPADAGDVESDTETDTCTPRTQCDAGECGSVDDGCGGTLDCGECPECQTPTDCAAGDNVDATCDSGSCNVGCSAGFVDVDGDLGNAGTGCECELTNGGAEVCDGQDNDCDGAIDNNPEPQGCALTAGVCAGVETSTCESGSYVACTSSDYGSDYVDAVDEGYRCDGLDNDCDGAADNPCCGSGSNPSFPAPSIIGNGVEPSGTSFPYNTAVEPAIAPAGQSAPSNAVAAVAYVSASDVVTVTHITAGGNPIGTPYTRTENNLYTGVELVRTDKGYDLIYARTIREGNGGIAGFASIEVQQLTPALAEDGSMEQLTYQNNDTFAPVFRNLDASYQDRSVVVAATMYSGFNEIAKGFFYRIDSVDSTTVEITIDGAGSGTAPRTVDHVGGHLLVSVDENDDRMYGKAIDSSGNPTGSFDHSPSATEGALYLAWVGGNEAAVVYEDSGALSAATVNFSAPSTPSPSQLTSGDALGEFIVGTDWDDDQNGDAESTTLIWRDAGATQLEAAEFDLTTGTSLNGPTSILDGAGNIDSVALINDGKQIFAVYQDRSTSQVKFFRSSRAGVALCD